MAGRWHSRVCEYGQRMGFRCVDDINAAKFSQLRGRLGLVVNLNPLAAGVGTQAVRAEIIDRNR